MRLDPSVAKHPDLAVLLAAEVAPLGLLGELMEWAFARRPRIELTDVVVQDEYTHDVVLRFDAEHWLVFDTT